MEIGSQDINIVNDAYQKKLEYAPQTYKYLAIKLRRPQQSATANAGVLKFDIGDGVTAGNLLQFSRLLCV